jgi:hypothetical protein
VEAGVNYILASAQAEQNKWLQMDAGNAEKELVEAAH